MNKDLKFDEIGNWSEIKLDIIREYAKAYSTILSNQKRPRLKHVYIDAFAGPGANISRLTGEFVLGSPLNALLVNPPFCEYYLIDIDRQKVNALKEIVGNRNNVYIFEGDCNKILLEKVFPKVHYRQIQQTPV